MSDEQQETPSDIGGKDNTGVTVSEEFQQHAHKITHKATKHELHHLRGRIYDREDALRKEEEASKTKGKKPIEFTTDNMPASP